MVSAYFRAHNREREEVQLSVNTTDITLNSTVGECDCSVFLGGYVHQPQSSLCFRVMLLHE